MEIVGSQICRLRLIIPSLHCVGYRMRIAQNSLSFVRFNDFDMLTGVGPLRKWQEAYGHNG
jgi:hypothetical protein